MRIPPPICLPLLRLFGRDLWFWYWDLACHCPGAGYSSSSSDQLSSPHVSDDKSCFDGRLAGPCFFCPLCISLISLPLRCVFCACGCINFLCIFLARPTKRRQGTGTPNSSGAPSAPHRRGSGTPQAHHKRAPDFDSRSHADDCCSAVLQDGRHETADPCRRNSKCSQGTRTTAEGQHGSPGCQGVKQTIFSAHSRGRAAVILSRNS